MKITFFLFLTILGLSACSISKSSVETNNSSVVETEETSASTESTNTVDADESKIVGIWTLKVMDTPNGDVDAEMLIELVDGSYKGYMVGEAGKIAIKSLDVKESNISGTFFSSDYSLDVSFNLKYDTTTDKMSGYVMDSFRTEGKRKME